MDILKKKDAEQGIPSPEHRPEPILVQEVTKEISEQTALDAHVEALTLEQPIVQQPVSQVVPASSERTAVRAKDAFEEQIEDILEEDLTDVFLAMSPKDQQLFKAKGEETTSKIRELLNLTKDQTKKIFDLIRAWLKIIPGVNRFFLEQEAKIKTDKIKHLSEQRNQDHSL